VYGKQFHFDLYYVTVMQCSLFSLGCSRVRAFFYVYCEFRLYV